MDCDSNFSNIYCSVDRAWDSGLLNIIKLKVLAVTDPDLEIRGRGGGMAMAGHPDLLIKKKNFFRSFGPQFDLKIRK